jgi:oligo-1,6-glucosidase/alpha-glucosidase
MKILKKLLLLLIIVFVLFLFLFVYINVKSSPEKLPFVQTNQGQEEHFSKRFWWQSTTVYQVYPRSFKDSNNDGIGDIAGIISKLDYIKNLGFETIWFSPFFKSPQKDFGYDVSDYYMAASEYGNNNLLDSLIEEIHSRDMKVVFDLVLNHTSDQHPWFLESRSGKNNPKSDWYIWKDGNGSGPPNNWHSVLGSNGWHFDDKRDQWYFSAFLEFQPDLNWRNPEVKQAMFEVVRYWLDKGVDGFRLDIFNFIYEDAGFKDNPGTLRYLPSRDMTRVLGQNRQYTMNHPDNFQLAKELRAILEEYSPERFMVGEVFGDHATLQKFVGKQHDGLNLVFLFDITDFKWNADFFRKKIKTFEAYYPYPAQPTYVFSNHDRPRSLSLLDNDRQKAKALALIQMTLRGVPFVYQGEEIGMHTASIPNDKALDPLPAAFSWLPAIVRNNVPLIFNRDNCRTPMQWNKRSNAGFTEDGIESWLPIQNSSDSINVRRQLDDPSSLLQTFKEILFIRNNSMAIKWGSLEVIESADIQKDILAFSRVYKDDKISVYINFSNMAKSISVEGELLYSTASAGFGENNDWILPANSGILVQE